jgi:cyclopropane-fatty-acyl-phospholipid synthase
LRHFSRAEANADIFVGEKQAMSSTTVTGLTLPAKPRDKRLQLGLQLGHLVRVGTLTVQLPGEDIHTFEGAQSGPAATLIINDPRTIAKTVYAGSLGFSEAYLKGWWDSPTLTDMLVLGTANEASWDAMINGKPWMRFLSMLMHKLRPNTRNGSKRNIADHYDLGNDFYELWLDPSMTYSAAMFADGANSLEAAQQTKMRRICNELQLSPGKKLLEIGCGWGGFAELAASEFGVEVVAITLSREQLAYTQARIGRAGLTDKVAVKLQDYRDVQGSFDAIASIEMIEAVGEKYWPTYFATLHDHLKPTGLACIQAITIAERYFEGYRTAADFIQRYVFPGGMLASPSRLRQEAERAGLKWRDAHWFGQDYAETLKQWQTAFQNAWPKIAQLPAAKTRYDAQFKRLWEYYLAYCEAGFRAQWTDVGHILIAR